VKTILVVANETLGGKSLLDAVRSRAAEGEVRFVICVPQNRPRSGLVVYDDAVFDAAQVRVDLALEFIRAEHINAIGEVGDPDPYTATMDAIAEYRPSEIIISTYPAASSGWLRRDLIERIAEATQIPVEHLVVDLDQEGLPFGVTLVVANKTAASPALLDALKERADDLERHVFIFVVPQEGGQGVAARQARARLTQMIDRARAADLICAGMIADPDPYNAVMNALQFFRVDDIVISTLPATRSGWMRADLIERVRRAANRPVEHVESTETEAAA
jgi:nucleotide-binding universal stress UspA family protein